MNNNPERSRAIVPLQRVILDDAQRDIYKEAIMPYVLTARAAYHRSKRSKTEKTQEEFRLAANDLIIEVNTWKATFAESTDLVEPEAVILVGRPQIPPLEKRNKFTKPDSPVRPHNASGTLAPYREKGVRPDLVEAIRREQPTTEPKNIDVSLAVVFLVPAHLVNMPSSAPLDLRRPDQMAKAIVGIAQTVKDYDSGLLQPPTAEELGLPSPKQDQHIAAHLRALLAHFLRDELNQPNRTEKQFQDLYRKLSDFVREAARHITPQRGDLNSSYERIGQIIEGLPGIEGPMLASRVSTRLYEDLGLPCLDSIGELRLAEVIRNIAGRTYWSKGNRADMSEEGYRSADTFHDHISKIIDSICDRLETGEIDCQALFGAIASLDYGETVIEKLIGIADDDQRGILLRALLTSNCFDDQTRFLIKRFRQL